MVRLAQVLDLRRKRQLLTVQLDDDTHLDITSIAPTLRSFFEGGPSALRRATEAAVEAAANGGGRRGLTILQPSEVRLLSPLSPSECTKFICIGMNYVDHCTEQNAPIPEEPVIFSKFGSSIIGPDQPIVADTDVTTKLDYEVELGVLIGTTVPRHTSPEAAMDYVGGYTVIHDVSARDWQLERNGGQWLLGKCGDGYAPLGPVVVTPDSLPRDPHDLGIRCRLNGVTMQDSSTSNLIHKIDALIAFLSRFVTLQPGDVIATGTPPGVGCFRKPPVWLKPGDVVECEIDGIGTLSNPVVEKLPPPASAGAAADDAAAAAEEGGNVSRQWGEGFGIVFPSTSSSQPSQPIGGRLHGQVCIVTGGARGIGSGIAAKLGSEGAAVVAVVDLHRSDVIDACSRLREVVPSCEFIGVVCDVSDADAVAKAWSSVAKRGEGGDDDQEGDDGGGGGRIDVLVQAAGIVGTTNVKTEDVDPNDFDDVFRVNVKGIFNGCKAALPYMSKRKYGRIINIASIAGKEGNAGMVSYSASKAAVIGLTKTVGKEYATAGVTCNAVAPAVVRTQMVEDMPDAQVKYMTDKIPMKRCGTIDEIANLVVFVASPEASFTTGFCFDATGGRAVY